MKICFVGGGAVGGYLAAHLARSKAVEVSVVARGDHLEAIVSNGLRIVTPDEAFTVPVRAVAETATLGVQDYVFVTLKQGQMPGAVDMLKPLLGSDTVVLSPTTGLPFWYFHGVAGPFSDARLPRMDPGGRQWTEIGPERAVGCVYWIGVQRVEPGVVRRHGTSASFPIGEPSGVRTPRLLRLQEIMQSSGIETPISADIRVDLWQKMISSMVWNPIAVLTEASLGQIAAAKDVVSVAHLMTAEAESKAAALGVTFSIPKETRIATTLAMLPTHRMSMLQDVENRRSTELPVFLDTLADLHDLVDVPTPTLDSVLALTALKLSVAGLHDAAPIQPISSTAGEHVTWWNTQPSKEDT